MSHAFAERDQVIYGQNDATVRELLQVFGNEELELLPAAARGATAGSFSPTFHNGHKFVSGTFLLAVTNAATDANDTLDVFIDVQVGGAWINIAHFAQVLGNGADTLNLVAYCPDRGAPAHFDVTADLAAGNARNYIAGHMRVRWVIVDPTGTNATFTFAVHAALTYS